MSNITYHIKKSSRAKHLRISVYLDGKVVVTIPMYISNRRAQEFINDKKNWVLSKLKTFNNLSINYPASNSNDKYLEFKYKALEVARQRIAYFNNTYKYAFNRITIRNQKTRWGSCSKNKNLNFNYKIVFLPPQLSDYIIVHELCHLGEFNHSRKFWDLVAITIPNYPDLRKRMRNAMC